MKQLKSQISGFVLAGGKSKRMFKDKGFVKFNNINLVEYPVNLLSKYCNTVYINANNTGYETFGYEVVKDSFKACGPLCGLLSCLEFSKTELNVFLPIDTPLITNEIIEQLIQNCGDSQITILKNGGHYEPLIGVYKKSIFSDLLRFYKEGNYKLIDIIKQLDTKLLDVTNYVSGLNFDPFANFNSPEDLTQLH